MISGCSKSFPSQNFSLFQYTIVRRCCIRLLLDFPGFNAISDGRIDHRTITFIPLTAPSTPSPQGKYRRSEEPWDPPLLCSIIALGQPKGTRDDGWITPPFVLLFDVKLLQTLQSQCV